MGQALYRKYRPKSLGEVVGQEHIARTLENALKKGAIGHAYLFTGPHGTGKTSVARILAHEINTLSYTDDSTHLDIIEIDAASNRRIDEIRDLRDRVNIAPTSAKYKVYIIDEVHMLTREAFNALLKTLEEPPAHVVFILATTELHKLPETIVSRTQRFTFKPVPLDKIVMHLRNIADQEKISVSDEALQLIAKHGGGTFRDSISLLDQASGVGGEINEPYVQTMLGIPPAEALQTLTNDLLAHNAPAVIRQLAALHEQGYSAAQIAKKLGEAWRAHLIDTSSASTEAFTLLRALLQVPASHEPQRYLEIVLLEYALAGQSRESNEQSQDSRAKSQEKITQPPAHGKPTDVAADEKHSSPAAAKPKKEVEPPAKAKIESKPAQISAPAATLDAALWPQLLAELKKKHNTLYSVVRMAQPQFGAGTLELGFAFAFHRKRVSEAKNQTIIADTIRELTGHEVAITCAEGDPPPAELPEATEVIHAVAAAAPSENAAPAADLASINNIFGGAELLES